MIDFSRLNQFYIGNKEVQELYLGGRKVWEKRLGKNGVKFTANQAGSTVKLEAFGSPEAISMEYSTDDGVTYSTYTLGDTITLTDVGNSVLFRAGSGGNVRLAKATTDRHWFRTTGSVACSGNILYLLNQNGLEPQVGIPAYCFAALFGVNGSLTSAPDLPAMTLGQYCYQNMFQYCTSLTSAPYLPAMTLNTGCYDGMFLGCSNLNTIKIGYNNYLSSTYFNNWVYWVQTTSGTFYYNGADTTRGASAIPENWTITPFAT